MVLGRNVCPAGLILCKPRPRRYITIHHTCRHQELAAHCRQVICIVRRLLLLLQCLPLMCIALQHDGAPLQGACRPMRSRHTMRCSM